MGNPSLTWLEFSASAKMSTALWTVEPWYRDGILVGFKACPGSQTQLMKRWSCNPADSRSILNAARAADAYCSRMNANGSTGLAEVIDMPKAKEAK